MHHPAPRLVAALLLTLLLPGCGTDTGPTPAVEAPATAPTAPATPRIPLRLRSPDSSTVVRLLVEDAHEAATRRTGLMHRRQVPARGGMVFRYPEDRTGGFWMKDTLVPLSIAFFDRTGEVLVVLDMEPCEADPCPSYDPEVTYRGALEVNQGLFGRLGVEPGWTIELPSDLPAAT